METRESIIDSYARHLREFGEPPATVFKFCKESGIEERDFFTEFASFDAVESAYWRGLVDRVASAVEQGTEWSSFSAGQRFLAFLFAFEEESLSHRSLLLVRLGECGPLSRPGYLRGFEARFKEFAEGVVAHGISSGEIADRAQFSKVYPDALYVHFRAVIDFHLKDSSAGYESTDAFIEKSAALAFDLMRAQALDSAVDMARFLFQKRPAGGRA